MKLKEEKLCVRCDSVLTGHELRRCGGLCSACFYECENPEA